MKDESGVPSLVGPSILCQMLGLSVGVARESFSISQLGNSPTGAFPIGRCELGQALHQCSAYAAIMGSKEEHDKVERECDVDSDDAGVIMKCFDALDARNIFFQNAPHCGDHRN